MTLTHPFDARYHFPRAHQNEMTKLNIEELMTFYRHWLWANLFKNEYGKQLKRRRKKGDISGLYGPLGAYMFTWYGVVYSLIEFMDEKKIAIPEISKDIKMIRKRLQLSRNGVFHIQSEFGFEKLFKMIGPGGSSIIFKIHDSIGNHIEASLVARVSGILPEEEKILRKVMGDYVDFLKKKSNTFEKTLEVIRNQIALWGKFLFQKQVSNNFSKSAGFK